MMKYLILFICLVFYGILPGITIVVDIEGTGDYTSIQEGINASSDSDTILVYPGRYYENTDLDGKTITLASLEITTGNRNYIHTTIIDGNQTGCCVAVYNGEGEGTTIRGFTLINGIGFLEGTRRYGGGIYTNLSAVDIINCIIENNQAICGGGIQIGGGLVGLAGITIRNNRASLQGGGISSWNLSTSLNFSYSNRCNIYDNFSPYGLDIQNSTGTGVSIDVIVDTFTVPEPFGYELYQGDSSYNQDYDDMEFNVLHYKYERVEADLYVSPEGDDCNSGLSYDEPLQTISHAMQIISADAENPRTIYLDEGIYNCQDNNQKFPILMKSYVSIVGASEETTIIDLQDNHSGFLLDINDLPVYEVRNMQIINGFAEIQTDLSYILINIINPEDTSEPVLFENIIIRNNDYTWLILVGRTHLTLRNVQLLDNVCSENTATTAIYYTNFQASGDPLCSFTVENCKISGNQPSHINISSDQDVDYDNLQANIISTEFSNNTYYNNGSLIFPVTYAVAAFDKMTMNIVNCTFANNELTGTYIASMPIYMETGVRAEIINSIFYGNSSYSIFINGNYEPYPELSVHHCLIENGYSSVMTSGGFELDWDTGTISEADPLFLIEGEYPFRIDEDSPAIDLGTLNLPEGVVLPEYDRSGNLRIRGNSIDLGAYEYNPFGNSADDNVIEINNDLLVYPNPVSMASSRNGKVKIMWQGEVYIDEVSLEVFNIKGQRIREFKIHQSSSDYDSTRNEKLKMNTTNWDLRNELGKMVSSGVYFVRVKAGDEYQAQQKVTVVK